MRKQKCWQNGRFTDATLMIYLDSNGFYTRPLQLAQRPLIRCSGTSNRFYMCNFAVIGAFISYDSHLNLFGRQCRCSAEVLWFGPSRFVLLDHQLRLVAVVSQLSHQARHWTSPVLLTNQLSGIAGSVGVSLLRAGQEILLYFAWVVDDAKCIVVTRVCMSVCVSVCLSVCLSACPRPYAHTTARTRM